jgi:hypothetical protein
MRMPSARRACAQGLSSHALAGTHAFAHLHSVCNALLRFTTACVTARHAASKSVLLLCRRGSALTTAHAHTASQAFAHECQTVGHHSVGARADDGGYSAVSLCTRGACSCVCLRRVALTSPRLCALIHAATLVCCVRSVLLFSVRSFLTADYCGLTRCITQVVELERQADWSDSGVAGAAHERAGRMRIQLPTRELTWPVHSRRGIAAGRRQVWHNARCVRLPRVHGAYCVGVLFAVEKHVVVEQLVRFQ